jgi:putative inorganic carbon (HCO3(-)) transporter
MPETWHERMATITDYQTDDSAMGRIMAWRMAFNLAMHRPLGGGFQTFRPSAYLMYLPEVGARRTDAHSVYFELMAEQGFIGLGLFLALGIFTFFTCGKIARRTRRSPEDAWMNELARMLQVSFVGYAAAGAFSRSRILQLPVCAGRDRRRLEDGSREARCAGCRGTSWQVGLTGEAASG